MKRTPILLAVAALVLLLAGGVLADDKKLKGKPLFKDNCKGCHGEEAEAGEYAPMFLIIEQWDRFFDEDYVDTHKDLAVSDDDTTKVVDAITPAMLKAIHDFCVYGAADSEHPMMCN